MPELASLSAQQGSKHRQCTVQRLFGESGRVCSITSSPSCRPSIWQPQLRVLQSESTIRTIMRALQWNLLFVLLDLFMMATEDTLLFLLPRQCLVGLCINTLLSKREPSLVTNEGRNDLLQELDKKLSSLEILLQTFHFNVKLGLLLNNRLRLNVLQLKLLLQTLNL